MYRLWPLVLALTAIGCAPTPYQPASGSFGFSETRLAADAFRVQFGGNRSTPLETIEKYLLYRCAELTIENGYDDFVVVRSDTETYPGRAAVAIIRLFKGSAPPSASKAYHARDVIRDGADAVRR